MNYVLFVGSRVGYEALRLIIELGPNIRHVFIETEHSHEHEKYYRSSIEACEKANVTYSLDLRPKEVERLFSEGSVLGSDVDYIFSFGYRRMISKSVLETANIAALGTHFSPLPRYRGFAPLNWLLINGETETAVNLFYLEQEVDSGAIVDREFVKIDYEDNINSLFDKCIKAFRELMARVVPKLECGEFEAEKQDETRATYTCARNPEDGCIDWNWSSRKVYNFVRALTYPYPGAYSYKDGKKLTVWSCLEYEIPHYEGRIPGKVVRIMENKGVVILCGEGAVLLNEVQIEGGTRVTADRVIKSVRLTLGLRDGCNGT